MRGDGFLVCLMLASCGGGAEAPSAQEAAPFRRAVEAYLREQSLAMRPDSFLSLSVDGETASAQVQMRASDAGYGLRPRWEFRFRKKDGAWAVSEVTR